MPLVFPDYISIDEPEDSGFVTASDGIKIRYGRWKSAKAPVKGTILLLHGRAEYIEKYYETINEFRANGFEVVSIDWRGQGGSDRMLDDPRKGYVDQFEDYILDLEAIIQDVLLPDCKAPFFIVAHSTGSLISLLAAPKIPNNISRMVLCSPFLGVNTRGWPPQLIKIGTGAMTSIGMGESFVGRGGTPTESMPYAGNRVTSDSARFMRNRKFIEQNRELSIGGPTANWLYASCEAIDLVFDPDFYSQISIPMLFVIAGGDEVVSASAAEQLALRLRNASSITIDGAKHELFQEQDKYREQVLAAIDAFIPGSGNWT